MNPKFTITTWEPKECWPIAKGHEKDSGNILPMFVLDAGTKLLSEKQSFVLFCVQRSVCWSRGLHEASADQFRKCSLLVSLQFRFMPSRMTCISDRRLKTSPKNAPSSRCWRKVMWIFKSAKHFWSLTNNTALQHSAQQLKHKGTNCLQQSWDPTLILRDLIYTLSLSCNLHCSVMHPRLTRVPTRDCTSRV